MKIVLIISFCLNLASALSFKNPDFTLQTEHFITTIMTHKNTLFVGTNSGIVEQYDIKTRKKQGEIKLEKIHDYFGNLIAPRIFHTHTIDNKKILIVSQDSYGSSKISIFDRSDSKFQIIALPNEYSIIKKAYFIDENRILIGFLSNEIMTFNIKNNEILWITKPSMAVFSDLIISENLALSSTEGGIIYFLDLKNGEILYKLEGANYDNINMLASAKNIALTAGTDKACGIYNKTTHEFLRLKTEFLAYAVGISPDSMLGAVSYNENNDILVFSTNNAQKIAMLSGGNALPNGIVFIDNKTLIASFDSKSILFWTLGE